MRKPKSFRNSVERFIKSADWLSDEDAPAVFTLLAAADALDEGGPQAALINAFGLCYRNLLSRRPADTQDDYDGLSQR